MAYKRKTWHEKMHPGFPCQVVVTQKKFADIPAGASMFVATPEIVSAYISNIPFGAFTSLQQMRKDLAAEHHADYCCPVTSGIFLRIVAEATWEDIEAGKTPEEVTPFWRMMDPKSPAAKKLTFGTDLLSTMQRKEGIVVLSAKARK